jgi:hypothetical protein
MVETRSGGKALSRDTCRDRLASNRRGYLACTTGGLPAVVPVRLINRQGELLLRCVSLAHGDRLAGQVVALSIGRNVLPSYRGWTVTAHGRLGPLRPDGLLPLDIAHLEGVSHLRDHLGSTS